MFVVSEIGPPGKVQMRHVQMRHVQMRHVPTCVGRKLLRESSLTLAQRTQPIVPQQCQSDPARFCSEMNLREVARFAETRHVTHKAAPNLANARGFPDYPLYTGRKHSSTATTSCPARASHKDKPIWSLIWSGLGLAKTTVRNPGNEALPGDLLR